MKDFIRMLNGLERSRSTYDKFRDLCEMAYCAFAKLMATPDRAEVLEQRYMSIVNGYPNKDTVRAYPELIGMAWNAVKAGGIDFLGEAAAQLEILDARNGQFFTPWPVSRMMAEMTVEGLEDVIAQQGYITLQEPAAGAGGMVLAYADAMAGRGFDPTYSLLVNAIDISPLCYHMCYLQLTWRGIPALVERANTLSLEKFEAAWTLPTMDFYGRHGRLFEKPMYESEYEQTYEPALVQLSLFEGE